MTSAIPPSAQPTIHHSAINAAAATAASSSGATSPLPAAVPAQLPVRSYANATKTASAPPPAAAGASAQDAKSSESPVNGVSTMAHGGSQPNGLPPQTHQQPADHGRKPSVVINASGASGSIPNGGPVGQNGRPHINFGAMGESAGLPYHAQPSSLPAPPRDPRVISPAHSPSPIPHAQSSGGRPPIGLPNQGNGMTFGQLGSEGDQYRQGQIPLGPNISSLHERRTSSQSMHSDMSNSNMSNMNRPAFMPPNGRGRGAYPAQGYNGGMPSPGPGYRSMSGPQVPRPNMQAPFPGQPPSFPHPRSNSPAVPHARPNMGPYGFQPNMNPQNAHMFGNYEPYGGYYPPYGYGQYPGQPPQSPRPPYPSPYNAPPPAMAAPFNPPEMSRSASQSSQRPPSSMGQPQTPAMANQLPHGQTPVPQQAQAPSSNFVRPRKTNAIKITDAQGNEVNFTKAPPTPSQAAPQTPVIVSTPNAPTPPPRAPSGQHMRAESKTTKSSEETKNAFQEQVKRQVEEQKRKQLEEEEAAKAKAEREETEAQEKAAERERAEAAAQEPLKEATVAAEKAAAVAADDKEGVQDAEAAEAALKKDEGEKTEKEETEEERIEREIAEMEAAEREEEERERAYEEKKRKEREEAAARQAELDKKRDEELRRQEREAEELADAREREREAERQKQNAEPDDEAKAMFASLKKSAFGPGASAPESGAETPISEKDEEEAQTREQTPEPFADRASMPPPSQPASRAGAAAKPRPANLKLETTKRIEPAEPTPGMQALKSARFLEIKEEARYPEGVRSPNPALNLGGARKSRAYDRDFLMQFQNVFKEKPSVDWDMKIKETLGPSDDSASARPNSGARTPSGMQRAPSGRPVPPSVPSFGGPMGSFGGNARGTSSEQRFAAANMGGRPAGPGMGMGPIRVPSNLGIGAPGMPMGRPGAVQGMGAMGAPQSPRQPSGRSGRGASKRDTNRPSAKQEAEMAAKMPLTAHMEIAPLQKSNSGWVATSIGRPSMAGPDPSGHLAPDVVQKKVKGALNKMTPDNFDKITDQILEIAHQSKNETDGRTLRQVIQLTFEKACDEAHWAGMYARFCAKMLTTMSSEIQDETIKDRNGQPVVGGALFRKYLLNRCQEEFERGWQANLPAKPEGEGKEAALLSDEYYIAAAAKRRGLGLIQFIGQLYKLRMLTIKIMHECVLRLLNFEGDPDEATVENLTTLLKSVGSTMDQDEQGQSLINAYFQRIEDLFLKSDKLASRPKFMIMDLIDLRKAGWKGKGETKGPKTIEEIRAEAAAAQVKAEAERQKLSQRPGGGGRMQTGRGDARQFSGSAQPPVDINRTTVGMDDLRKLQQRNASNRQTGGGLGPSLGPGGGLSALSGRGGSRRGNLGPPASGNSTRTNTPPVEKKDEPSPQSNAFSALAALDPSGEDAASQAGDATSPPSGTRNRSKSPLPSEQGEDAS